MSLLDRVRSFVLAFSLLASAPVFVALARAPRLPLSRVAGAAAVAVIAVAWIVAWRKKKLGWAVDLLTAAALAVMVSPITDAHQVQGFFFAALMFNGLYGGAGQLVLRLVLVPLVFFAHGETSPFSAIGFVSAGVVTWALGRAIEEQNRAAKAARELEIAAQIQTALLPRAVNVPGFELAASMVPAEAVGGDYHDVFALPDGCLIGIGDVSGHGLVSGLVMVMLQSSISTLVRARPEASPAELLVRVNEVLYDNIHDRLGKHEHVTMTLLKLERSGRVTFAGAHEELIVLRAGGTVEALPTPGTWLGAMPDIAPATKDATVTLAAGDVLLLHTDGVTEARNARGEQLGLERLLACVERLHGEPPQGLIAGVRAEVDAWSASPARRDDDVTLLAARFSGA